MVVHLFLRPLYTVRHGASASAPGVYGCCGFCGLLDAVSGSDAAETGPEFYYMKQ